MNSQRPSMISTPEATRAGESVLNNLEEKEEEEGRFSSGLASDCFLKDSEGEESGREERRVRELKEAMMNATYKEIQDGLAEKLAKSTTVDANYELYLRNWTREWVEEEDKEEEKKNKEEEKKDKELNGRFDRMEEDIERLRRDIGWITPAMTDVRSAIRWMGVIMEMMTVFGISWATVAYIF